MVKKPIHLRNLLQKVRPSFLFFLIPPCLARLYLLHQGFFEIENMASVAGILRGFASDLAVGGLIGLLGYLLYRKAPPVYWLLWMAWCLLVAFNMDHIRINDANVNYAHWPFITNRRFFRECIFAWPNLYHWGVILFGSGFIVLILTWKKRSVAPSGWRALLAIPLCLCLFFLPMSSLAPNWVQAHPVEENVKRLAGGSVKIAEESVSAPQALEMFFSQDLSGDPLIPYPSGRQNILLIILENLSYDTAFSGQMPYLKRLAERHLSYKNFLSLQRQSNRGFYALMCGDYPNFISLEAKADILLAGRRPYAALPSILAAHGYNTLFLEANELGFFQRDLFCQKIGFQKSLGRADYPRTRDAGGWGVADEALFGQTLREIKTLRQSDRPWFATLFTGGTHYPYTVPGIASPTLPQAIAAMDRSLNDFLTELDKSGILSNTLVIITSDEAGLPAGTGLQRDLSMQHVPLIVLAPHVLQPLAPDGLFTQKDLLSSICDYLGLEAPRTAGRSIFRTYRDDPNILFGNIYTSRRYAYLSTGRLYVYSTLADQWLCYRMPRGQWFVSSARALPDPADIDLIRKVFLFNETTFDQLNKQILFRQTDVAYAGPRALLGGHKISCRAGDRLYWKTVIEAEEPVELQVRLTAYQIPVTHHNRNLVLMKKMACTRESPCIFHYEYQAKEDIGSVATNIDIKPSGSLAYVIKELSIQRLRTTDSAKDGAI